MSQIARLRDAEIANGNLINADDISAELDQLVVESNNQDTRITDIESGDMTFYGEKTFEENINAPGINANTANGFAIDGTRLYDGYLNIAPIQATVSDVDPGTDLITTAEDTDLSTGDAVKYRADKGAVLDTGLSESTVYYWRVVSDTSGTLHPTSADAVSNANRVDITAEGSGTRQIIALPNTPREGDLWIDYRGLTARVGGSTVTFGQSLASVVTKNSSYTALSSDESNLFVCTGTFTLSLTAAATLGTTWFCHVRNDGTGVITVDPNSSETIDGQTTIKVYPGEAFTIVCDGSNFKTIGRQKGWVTILSQTASSSTTIDFTLTADTEIDDYEIDITDLVPATDATQLQMRFSISAAYLSANYEYGVNSTRTDDMNESNAFSTSDSAIKLTATAANHNIGNASGEGYGGTVRLLKPTAGTLNKRFHVDATHINEANSPVFTKGGGAYMGGTGVLDGVRFLMSSGNITSGTFVLKGYRK